MVEDWRGCKAKDDINKGDLPDRAARSSGGWRGEVAKTIRPVTSSFRDTFVRVHRRELCWRNDWRFDVDIGNSLKLFLANLDWGFPAGCRPQRPPRCFGHLCHHIRLIVSTRLCRLRSTTGHGETHCGHDLDYTYRIPIIPFASRYSKSQTDV